MTTYRFLLPLLLLFARPAIAGVVYEIEVESPSSAPGKTEVIEMAIEGRRLKMGTAPGPRGGRGDMIFDADRKSMVVIDHADKSYVVMDEATMKSLADQAASASAQMEEALANVPPEQRAMMEKMMKDRLPTPSGPDRRKVETKVRRTGEKGQRGGYPCVEYEVSRDGKRVRELWVTASGNVEGASDAAALFKEMAGFFKRMTETLAASTGGAFAAAAPSMVEMDQIDGFPVETHELGDDGSVVTRSRLRSARRAKIAPKAFEPPAGYERRSMGPQ